MVFGILSFLQKRNLLLLIENLRIHCYCLQTVTIVRRRARRFFPYYPYFWGFVFVCRSHVRGLDQDSCGGDDRQQGRSLSLPPELSWSCPSDVTTTDENEPPKIRVKWEELSCSSAHDGGGLDAVVVGVKTLYKEKESF